MAHSEIKPALTAEEWAEWREKGWLPKYSALLEVERLGPEDRHAYAALCLDGQPSGFTRKHEELVRNFIGCEWGRMTSEEMAVAESDLDSLANLIEALLPPEDEE